MIIGAKGIALSYVIQENNAPNLEEQETWEERVSLAVPLSGNAYAQDRLTVHNIILRNIADGSDAFTYVKPHLKKEKPSDARAIRQ
jgi:hypothetical protein